MLFLAIFMWIKLDIRHYIFVLTGTEAKRSIESIRQRAADGSVNTDMGSRRNRAKITWNTSDDLAGPGITYEGDEKTTLLDVGGDPDATTLLDAMSDTGFKLEREIINKDDGRV